MGTVASKSIAIGCKCTCHQFQGWLTCQEMIYEAKGASTCCCHLCASLPAPPSCHKARPIRQTRCTQLSYTGCPFLLQVDVALNLRHLSASFASKLLLTLSSLPWRRGPGRSPANTAPCPSIFEHPAGCSLSCHQAICQVGVAAIPVPHATIKIESSHVCTLIVHK